MRVVFCEEALLEKNELPGCGVLPGDDAVEVDTRGIACGVPFHAVFTAVLLAIGERGHVSARDVEDVEADVTCTGERVRDRGTRVEGLGLLHVVKLRSFSRFGGGMNGEDPCGPS